MNFIKYLLFLFIVSLPFDQYQIFSISSSDIFLILLLICLFFKITVGKQKIKRNVLYPFFFLFFLSCLPSIFSAYSLFESLRITITLAGLIGIFLVLFNIIKSEEYLFFTIKTILFSSAIISVLSISQFVMYRISGLLIWASPGLMSTGYKYNILRVAGPIKDPNYLALFLLPAVILGMYILFSQSFSNKIRAMVGFISFLNIITLILTFSRSFILLFIIFLVYFWIKNFKHKICSFFLVSFIIIMGIFLREKIIALIVDFNPASIQMRFENLIFGLRVFSSHYLFGIGFGNLKLFPGNPHFQTPHNTYVQMLAEVGIFSAVIFSVIVLMLFISIKNKKMGKISDPTKVLVNSAQASLLFMLLGGFFLGILMLKIFWLYITVAMIASSKLLISYKNNKKEINNGQLENTFYKP